MPKIFLWPHYSGAPGARGQRFIEPPEFCVFNLDVADVTLSTTELQGAVYSETCSHYLCRNNLLQISPEVKYKYANDFTLCKHKCRSVAWRCGRYSLTDQIRLRGHSACSDR